MLSGRQTPFFKLNDAGHFYHFSFEHIVNVKSYGTIIFQPLQTPRLAATTKQGDIIQRLIWWTPCAALCVLPHCKLRGSRVVILELPFMTNAFLLTY